MYKSIPGYKSGSFSLIYRMIFIFVYLFLFFYFIGCCQALTKKLFSLHPLKDPAAPAALPAFRLHDLVELIFCISIIYCYKLVFSYLRPFKLITYGSRLKALKPQIQPLNAL